MAETTPRESCAVMETASGSGDLLAGCGCCDDDTPTSDTRWRQQLRNILTWLSGIVLITALMVDLLQRGFTAVMSSTDQAPISPLATTLYLTAVIAGVAFVAPRAWRSLKTLRPDMNLLMFMAVIGAIILGELFEAATVSFLFAFSLMLESWSIGRARHAIEALMELAPDTARVIDGDEINGEMVPVSEVPVGAAILVKSGERIPLDGEIRSGRGSVDQAAITGESIPVDRAPGDQVFAGTVNGDAVLEIVTTHAAGDTTLARIMTMVENARARRARSEQWVERFALWYTPAMIGIALMVALLPPILTGGEWSRWFYQALVILVIACPCALVISTPVSVVAGLARAARMGVLIKGGLFLEIPARLRVIAFDKTGTLSAGRPVVEALAPADDIAERELLDLAASLEIHSGHPLARAIVERAGQEGIRPRKPAALETLPGRGIRGEHDGRSYWVGNRRLVEELGFDIEELGRVPEELTEAGHTLLFVAAEMKLLGVIGIRDPLRPESRQVMADLAACGVENRVILSGDSHTVAEAMAREIGADQVLAELLPDHKAEAVIRLREQHGPCAMIGDGINDAPALATADLGIAMGAMGSDAAIETADIALMTDDLRKIPWLVRHSRRVMGVIKQNLILALALKMIFMGLAIADLATLWMAIAADMGASLLVIGNSLRLLSGREEL